MLLSFPLDICPGIGKLGHIMDLLWVFWGISVLSSYVMAVYIPTNRLLGCLSLQILASICYFFDFWIKTTQTRARWYLTVVLIFISLMASGPAFFHVFLLFVFHDWVVCLCVVEFLDILIYSGYQSFIGFIVFKYFFPFSWLSLHFVDCSFAMQSLLASCNPICPFLLLLTVLLGSYQLSCCLGHCLEAFLLCFPLII